MLNPPDRNTVIEFPQEDGSSFLEADDYGYFPPLGLLYVLSYAEKNTTGHEFFFIDCCAEKIDHNDLAKKIEEIQPDIIGMTSFTISLVDIRMAAETAKKICPDVHICLGGHHSIAYPFEATQLDNIDSVVVGEGEKAFTELINRLEARTNYEDILGVYNRESIQKTAPPQKDRRFINNLMVKPAYIENLDELPPPNRKYIKHINYSSILGISNNMATLITSRGCPYLCTFCNVPYKQYRERNFDLILDEVEECIKLGYDEFHFYDDLFNVTPKKVLNFCEAIKKRGLKFTWDFRGRVNSLTRESLFVAKEAGCRMISFGVETGTNEGLMMLKKGCNVTKIENAFKWCKEAGIITVADYMLGLPSERSKEDILKNIDFVIELDPDYVQFNILTLYPHTEAYKQAVDKGLIVDGRWQKFALDPKPGFMVDHWEEFLTTSELVKLQKRAYQKFYFRPRYIFNSVKNTKTMYQFFTKVKGAAKLFR